MLLTRLERLRGEAVAFLSRTAYRFAIRQTFRVSTAQATVNNSAVQVDPDKMLFLAVSGFSNGSLCGFWRRAEFESCNRPVFHQRNWLYLHFRPGQSGLGGQWVIEEGMVSPAKPVVARSKTEAFGGAWESAPSPILIESFYVNCSGNSVSVKGSEGSKHTRGFKLDGTYTQDKDKPTVFARGSKGLARYIFFNGKTKRWYVGTASNLAQPPLLHSGGGELSNLHGWYAEPDDWNPEPKANLRQLNEGAARELWPDYFNASEELLDTELPLGDLLTWADSPQDALLSSNQTQTVHVLSLDPNRLDRRMHPGLYQLLEARGVNLGHDFLVNSTDHAAILSALTGVQRSTQEAAKLLGEHYVLTGDSVLKILAIYMRICSGVPVVVSARAVAALVKVCLSRSWENVAAAKPSC